MELGIVILSVLAYLTACVLLGFAEFLASSSKSPIPGLVPAFILLFLNIGVLTTVHILYPNIFHSLALFILLDAPLVVVLRIYLSKRRKKHAKLLSDFRAIIKENPVNRLHPLPEVRELISEFYDPSVNISAQDQRGIISSVKSGVSTLRTKLRYDCKEEDIKKLSDSFEKFCTQKADAEIGKSYSFSERQRELLFQIIISSTPKNLGIGNGLLWTKHSIRQFIGSVIKMNISMASVEAFMDNCKLSLPDSILIPSRADDARFNAWVKTEFEHIRMRSLEEETDIVFLYAVNIQPSQKSRKMTMLAAVPKTGIVSFGIYKDNSGYKDFIDKLMQEHSDKLFAIIDSDELFAKFSGIATKAKIIAAPFAI